MSKQTPRHAAKSNGATVIEKNAEGLFETNIGNHHFAFQKWGTTQSVLTLLDFMKVSHMGIGEIAALMFANQVDTEEVTGTMVSRMVSQLLEGLSREPQKTLSVMQKLVSDRVQMDGRRVNFEIDFADDFELLFDVIAAAFEVQYRNFTFVSNLIQRFQGPAIATEPKPA